MKKRTLRSIIIVMLYSIMLSFALIDFKPTQYGNIVTGGDTITLTRKSVQANENIGVSFGMNIFSNPRGQDNSNLAPGTIAPGVSGSYKFTLKNKTFIDFTYLFNISDSNEYLLPMVYRLRNNNEYVIGSDSEWLKVSEIAEMKIVLSANENKDFILDWKWDEMSDSDYDNFLGHLAAGKDIYYYLYFTFRVYSYGDLSYLISFLALVCVAIYYILLSIYKQKYLLTRFTNTNRRRFFHKPSKKIYNVVDNKREVYKNKKENKYPNNPLKGRRKVYERVYSKDDIKR